LSRVRADWNGARRLRLALVLDTAAAAACCAAGSMVFAGVGCFAYNPRRQLGGAMNTLSLLSGFVVAALVIGDAGAVAPEWAVMEGAAWSEDTARVSQASQPTDRSSAQDVKGTEDARYWQITPNEKLKGPTGRIVLKFPGEASVIFHVLDASGKQLVAWYENDAGNFMPGTYTIRIWDSVYKGMPVKKNMDTRIKVGVLKLNITEPYKILDGDGGEMFSGHPAEKNAIVFPVGKYIIQTSTLKEPIEIKDGEVTDF
jgi:hypothetical protein